MGENYFILSEPICKVCGSEKYDAQFCEACIWDDIRKDDERIEAFNNNLLTEFNILHTQVAEILNDCNPIGEYEIVNKPSGDDQKEKTGKFKQIFVDQWSVGDSGDSWEGYIYGRFSKGKWLKIHYSC